MMRFISVLFLLTGLAAAAFGGYRYFTEQQESELSVGAVPVEPPVQADTVEIGSPPTQADLPVQPQGSSRRAAAPEPRFERRALTNDTSTGGAGASFQERLYEAPVAYETPASASFGQTFQVTFAVDGTGDTTATDALSLEGQRVVEGQAKISDRIKASLVARAFEIELISPEVQRVSLLTENVWRWNVKAIEEGEHTLIFELFALDGDEAVPVRTFRDEVVVSVSDFQRVIQVANSLNPIAIIISGAGTAIGGFLGFFRLFRRRRTIV